VLGASRTVAGTVSAAVVAYYQSSAFTVELGGGTKKGQRSLIERFRSEHGDKRLRMLERRHVQAYVSSLKSAAVQRNMLRALRHFLKFALSAGLIATDPSEGVSRAKMKSTGGFRPWTEEHVAQYEACHPVGSRARLALALYLNLGVRNPMWCGSGRATSRTANSPIPTAENQPHQRQTDHGAAASRHQGVDSGDAVDRHRDLLGNVVWQAVHCERVRQQDGRVV
jgi:hypothetical protein